MHKGFWPNGKDFAFTIVDDTDNGTIENLKPVYDFLYANGFKTTKTVWSFPSRNRYKGDCLQNEEYASFVKDLKQKGFEIGFHNAGSGKYLRHEIIEGLEKFKQVLGNYPSLHINHGFNPDNLYWGYKRYGKILGFFFKHFSKGKRDFFGDDSESEVFWGDHAKKHIKYIRNRVFNGINTLNFDPKMPYQEKEKQLYSNYWFSSSDGHTVHELNHLLSAENIETLKNENGLCIVYTHFASYFVNNKGELNPEFQEKMGKLASENGWFATTTEILDYLISKQTTSYLPSKWYVFKLDIQWLLQRIWKRIRHKR